MQLGKAITIARVEQDMSQGKLSELTGIAQQYLSRVERGKHSPSVHTAERIAAALNMTMSELLRKAESL